MRIPYLGLLALGGAQNQENNVIELEKQVIEQLEKGTNVWNLFYFFLILYFFYN
jgi:hypothetical protein